MTNRTIYEKSLKVESECKYKTESEDEEEEKGAEEGLHQVYVLIYS